MYQQFYKNTIQSNYIKYILQNTYIPTVPFTCNINHVTKGCTYIHNKKFVKAIKSEDMNQILHDITSDQNSYYDYFTEYDDYIFGERYVGLTTNYISNSDSYDSETHFYLGQYLKAYKAYYGVDLFPYYNCYSNEYLNNIDLVKCDNMPFVTYTTATDAKYKIISVPISLCQQYTIAIDCASEVLFCPAFVGKKGILEKQTKILHRALSVSPHEQLHLKSNYIHSEIYFNKPVYYYSPCIPGVYDEAQLSLPQYEKYLRLLIKIPADNTSSVTVLQGQYQNLKPYQDKYINLNIEDVSQYLTKTIQKDHLAGTSSDVEANSTLTYYGNLDNITRTFPSIIIDSRNGEEQIPILIDESANPNTQLNLRFQYHNLNENVETRRLIYPQETPCLKCLSNVEDHIKIDSGNFLDNYVLNNTQFSDDTIFKIRINGEPSDGSPLQSTSKKLNKGDILEVKAVGTNFKYDSAWSTPVIVGFEEYIKPNTTIQLDGTIIWEVDETRSTTQLDNPNNNSRDYLYSYKIIAKDNSNKIIFEEIRQPDELDSNPLKISSDQDNILITVKMINSNNNTVISSQSAFFKRAKVYIDLTPYFKESIIQYKLPSGNDIYMTIENRNCSATDAWSSPIYIGNNSDIKLIIDYGFNNFSDFCIISNTCKVAIDEDEDTYINLIITDFNISDSEFSIDSEYNFSYEYDKTKKSIHVVKILGNTTKKLKFNYINWVQDIIMEKPDITDYLNKYLYKNLSLLYINDTISYAFTSRLIEYLCNNVIDINTKFTKNIKQVQHQLIDNCKYKEYIKPDSIWSDYLRIAVFAAIDQYQFKVGQSNNIRDINGYVDKNSEILLSKRKNFLDSIQNTEKELD